MTETTATPAVTGFLDAWAGWLDELGIEHSGVIDTDKPIPYSVLVFRDPDNIQLELFHMAG